MSTSFALLITFSCIVSPAFCVISRSLGIIVSFLWPVRASPFFGFFGFVVLEIDHHSMDNQCHDIFSSACKRSCRGDILTWQHHPIQRQGGKIRLAYLQNQCHLDERRKVRSEQSSALCRVQERLDLADILKM